MMFYCKKKIKIITSITLGLFWIGSGLYAQMKSVQVQFKVLEENYKTFYGTDLNDLEEKSAALLAERFQENFPFVKFDVGVADTKLSVTIDRQKTQLENPMLHQVDVNLAVISGNGMVSEKIPFQFRSADQFFAPLPSSNAAFIEELKTVIDFWLNKEQEVIVKDVMSTVPLAEKAHPDSERNRWVLPFQEEICKIGKGSEFVVSSTLDDRDGTEDLDIRVVAAGNSKINSSYPEEYRGKILVKVKNPSELASDKMNDLKIEGIYLTTFIRAALGAPNDLRDFDIIENQ